MPAVNFVTVATQALVSAIKFTPYYNNNTKYVSLNSIEYLF